MWNVIALVSLIIFSAIEFTGLMRKLWAGFKDGTTVKQKKKGLGGYSENDPARILKMRESIYNLAFIVNLKNEAMDDMDMPEESRATSAIRFEVNVTALFCAFSQAFTSFLLLQDFYKRNDALDDAAAEAAVEAAEAELAISQTLDASAVDIAALTSDVIPAVLEDRSIILIKFICAVLFHFKFQTEMSNGLNMMKYCAMHYSSFENPIRAFLIGFTQMATILLVEIINLWNLSNITEGGTYSIMFDFIALGIIAEFDDYFMQLYKDSALEQLISSELVFENVKADKHALPNNRQVKLSKMLVKIKENLKLFRYKCERLPLKRNRAGVAEDEPCCGFSCKKNVNF